MKKLLLCAFLFLGFIVSSWGSSDDFFVDFLNVGQGNCTVVSFGPGVPPLIVDAGSSAADKSTEEAAVSAVTGGAVASSGDKSKATEEDASFNVRRMSQIGRKISSHIPWRKKKIPHLNVVISHGDIDHCNWITQLVEHAITGKAARIRALLGGSPDDYLSDKLSDIRKFANASRSISVGKVYVSDYEDTPIPAFECGDGECNILAADTATTDKNRHSIVFRG